MANLSSESLLELNDLIDGLMQKAKAQAEEIERLKKDIILAHAKIVELQNKYDNLKIAQSAITLSGGDRADAKKRLSNIVAEIDNCIAKLSQ